jgi:hypothetical protein
MKRPSLRSQLPTSISGRARWLLVVVGAAALASGLVLAVNASTPRLVPGVAGYRLPAALNDGHFLLSHASGNPAISAHEAMDLAREYAGVLALTPEDVSVQYVTFTDTRRGTADANGTVTPAFKDVRAWIIRFRGVPQPVFGRGGAGSAPLPAQELNVVVDAITGSYLEMFSFQ